MKEVDDLFKSLGNLKGLLLDNNPISIEELDKNGTH
jgi:hypothetical protein